MSGFLYRLHQLSRSAKKTPREDFLTLCVGRQLGFDPDFASGLVRRIAEACTGADATALRRWADTPPTARDLLVRPQAPARTPGANTRGAVDLWLRLSGPVDRTVVIEAKVGGNVPDRAQLGRYAQAFPNALVVGLVEAHAARANQPPRPYVTWDDVLAALPHDGDDPLLRQHREELRGLFADFQVGDPRLALPAWAWSDTVHALNRHQDLAKALEKVLVAMFPNDDLRRMAQTALERQPVDSTEAWGVGFCRGRAFDGTCVLGLTIGLKAGHRPDELAWILEVRPGSRRAVIEWLDGGGDGGWWLLRKLQGWYFRELHTTTGDRLLQSSDLGEVVEAGRRALREMHRHDDRTAWHARGSGPSVEVPSNLRIPDLNRAFRFLPAVSTALDRFVRSALTEVAPSTRQQPVRRYGDTWHLTVGDRKVRAEVNDTRDEIVLSCPTLDDRGTARLGRTVEALRVPGTTVELVRDGDAVRLRLTPQSWHDPTVRSCLAELARAAVGVEAPA